MTKSGLFFKWTDEGKLQPKYTTQTNTPVHTHTHQPDGFTRISIRQQPNNEIEHNIERREKMRQESTIYRLFQKGKQNIYGNFIFKSLENFFPKTFPKLFQNFFFVIPSIRQYHCLFELKRIGANIWRTDTFVCRRNIS